VLALAVSAPAGAQVVSFTTSGVGALHAGPKTIPLAGNATRVELGRDRAGWLLSVGGQSVRRFARRPKLRVAGARVTDRLAGRGPVTLLGARLLARAVHPGWLPGDLARSGAWMRGMPAAALWRMGRLDRSRRAAWWRRAMSATLRLRGSEGADTHDVGFLYGEGAAYGYDAGCRGRLRRPFTGQRCRALRLSAVAAADRLAAMIRANAPAAVLPTRLSGCADCPPGARETIIDSMMNVGLLVWAARRMGRARYGRLAAGHARATAEALIRLDGCTSQAAFTDATTGRAFGLHTHQGISAGSTWARGQAWAILGFARLARETRDDWAARVARALAGCWLAKAPRRGVVRFDLDTAAGPPDSSAQAVVAAGLATLAHVDPRRAPRWRAAARMQLAAAEQRVSRVPPLGRFGGQTYVAGGDPSDDNTELPIAPLYALDARALLAR
jgi:unsaturated chondroitin disaccharide hydrolase